MRLFRKAADFATMEQVWKSEGELEAVRCSVVRGRPFGDDRWAQRTAKRFGLESTFRPQGRPRTKPQP